jgi:hypothetical protein
MLDAEERMAKIVVVGSASIASRLARENGGTLEES